MCDGFIIIFYAVFYLFFFVIGLPLFNLVELDLLGSGSLVLGKRKLMT